MLYMQKLNENELQSVTGGASGRESELRVSVVLDKPFYDNYIVNVYLDGELKPDKTMTLDSSVMNFTLKFTGSGMKQLKVTLNNIISKNYVLDFDGRTVTEIK